MIEFTFDGQEFTNSLLARWFDDVSPDIGAGTILQEVDSGGGGLGGITFTPNVDATGFNYPLYVGKQLTAQSTRVVQGSVAQTSQGALGGRLLTLVDAPENVFGETVQVAINIMSDGTLQSTRANEPNTGIILRGIDQAGDSEMTLLGTSDDAIEDDAYLEIVVIHHATVGSVTVWQDGVEFWSLTDINTAVSGRNQSTSVLWGGYAVTGLSDDTLHHEDLDAVVKGDIMVINGSTNPDDPNDPISRIGKHVPVLSLPEADATYAEYVPDPVQDHYLNVNDVPPDFTSENYTPDLDQRDNFEMDDVAGTESDQVYVAYSGLVKTDIAAGCTTSGAPAEFQFMVQCVQPEPGTVTTDPEYIEECSASDFLAKRFETVCTISRDGESVQFREFGMGFTEHTLCLSPLSNPPFLCTQDFAGAVSQVEFNSSQNMDLALGEATYTLPFFSPWAGYALCTHSQQAPTATGDKLEFLVTKGVSIDVGFVSTIYNIAASPYTAVEAAFHFRWDTPDEPFFFCGTNFVYQGETTFEYEDTDVFSITINGADYVLRQNNDIVATITPGAMPAAVFAYCFGGRWRFNELTEAYDVPPGVKRCLVYVSGTGCINCGPAVPLVTEGTFPAPPATPGPFHQMEVTQWGMYMQGFEGYGEIFDPSINEGPSDPPNFEWDLTTLFTFKLESGSVVLEITDFVSLDGIPEVGGKGVWTYSRPYADTDDFFLQSPVPTTGFPVDANPTIDKTMSPTPASTPLRLVGLLAFDEPAGITDVSFEFVPEAAVDQFAGFMRQGGQDRSGTSATAPTDFAYRQSFLSSLPGSSETISLEAANEGEHGYTDPE